MPNRHSLTDIVKRPTCPYSRLLVNLAGKFRSVPPSGEHFSEQPVLRPSGLDE